SRSADSWVVAFPSMVARSPGRTRTRIGASGVPVSALANAPVYVPGATQIVSPGCTAAGWLSAVWRSQGSLVEPEPLGLPVAETWKDRPADGRATAVIRRSTLGGSLRGADCAHQEKRARDARLSEAQERSTTSF